MHSDLRSQLIQRLNQWPSEEIRQFIQAYDCKGFTTPSRQNIEQLIHDFTAWAALSQDPSLADILADADSADDPDSDTGGLERSRHRAGRGHSNAPTNPAGSITDFASAIGYQANFLGSDLLAPLPELPDPLATDAVVVDPAATGTHRFVLPYTHFSVVMNGYRRMPFYSAVNIDGQNLIKVPRPGRNAWYLDPRIPADAQAGHEIYRSSQFTRGHMTRRLDPAWGSHHEATRASDDTFCFTNACPQHADLNNKEWLDLENYVLDSAKAHRLRVCVFTGPVCDDGDGRHRQVQVPEQFWKVVVIQRSDTMRLSATGYMLSQAEMIGGLEFHYAAFRTYQVSLDEIARLTGLDFGPLPTFDPLDPARSTTGGLESATLPERIEIRGPADLLF